MLDQLFQQRSDNLESPEVTLNDWSVFGDQIESISGESVSVESSMRLSAVYSCIGVLSRSMGQLPMHVMRKENGKIKRATDHPLYYLLHDEPNPFQTSYDWRETSMVHVNGWGNGQSVIHRSRKGEVTQLELIHPTATELVKLSNGNYTHTIADDNGYRTVPLYDMLHIKAIGSCGKRGKSPILQCRESFAMGQAVQKYGNKFFGGGGRPTAIVSSKGALNKSSWELLQSAWKKAKNALRNEDNTTLLMPAELKYDQLTIAPEDAQFLETRKFSRSEINGLYNVPAHMTNDLEKATFSNISEQAISFVRHTMVPWVIKWEQELNRKLFTTAERNAGYYIKLNLNGLLRGTATQRSEFYTKAIRDGWMSRNEVRAMEEMNEVDGLSEFILSADLQPKEDPNEQSK